MPDTSPLLDLPYLLPAQAQKHVTHNAALQRLDVLVQLSVAEFGATTPPAAPEEGAVHALGSAPTGAWAGHADSLAAWDGNGWQFFAPRPGWRAWGRAEGALRVWDGAGWIVPPARTDDLDRLGIGTTADASNRLAVQAAATLLTHDGTDHRLKVNKAGAGDTASLLFQSGWTGHAEMGLAGNTDFSIKLSADGTGWTEALRLDAATGLPGGAAVQSDPADTTPGRLMTVGAFGVGATGTAELAPQDDIDALAATGIYRVSGATVGAPTNRVGMVLHMTRRDSSNTAPFLQLSIDSLGDVYARAASGIGPVTWDPWRRLYDTQSAVGTVSETGGAPTGALVERGSTADGEYVRHADGTQICWTVVTLTRASAACLDATWSFPAAFSSAPAIAATGAGAGSATPAMQELGALACLSATATSVGIEQYRISGMTDFAAGDMLDVHVTATGRWF